MVAHPSRIRWMNALIFSNMWVAIAAGVMTSASQVILSLPLNFLGLFVFFATLFVYNLQRLLRLNRDILPNPTPWSEWITRNLAALLVLSGVSAFITVVLLFRLRSTAVLILAPFGLISILYAGNFLKIRSIRIGLREIPFTKAFWISLTWVAVTVLLPQANAGIPWNFAELWWLAGSRFCLIASLAVAFDIRDLPYDMPFQRTVPQLLGVRKAVNVAVVLLLVHMLLVLFPLLFANGAKSVVSAQLLSGLIALQLLSGTHPQRSEWYFSGYLDGTLVLHGALVLLASGVA